jgi:hypothetical protein
MFAKNTKFIFLFLALLLVSLFIFYAYRTLYSEDAKNNQTQVFIPIQAEFENKIVYTTDSSYDTKKLKRDCQERQGVFNECGNICSGEQEVCASVCAYTCENINREKDSDKEVGIDNLIKVNNLKPEQSIQSPLTIEGEAKGTWFFEGEFPIVLTDWDGRIIAQTNAQAQGEWMTEDFVEFEATLDFTKPDTEISNRGNLILQKSNPSGLPEKDNAFELTVYFEE